ncbi:hypothetical protein PHJA_000739500 [Phtheirospermum japonicum]|uniref:EF-hand domain-containing protein n=1 Tax=Phtheirospermum japonicum TaxID=374723 RepID=A0A830BFJ7_9LAMI|nr:hypothetical protein PHJA_000739500 [Phtheirospermum japonicum]
MHKHSSDSMKGKSGTSSHEVMDGSDIMELVENEKVFSDFVDHKFQELDVDCDGKLSVKELQPAVDDIGAALGLPAQGTSPDSDHIYTEVLNEFTHGTQEKISKTEFKEVLSDFLLGMAAGLKRDPVVILRIDGEDLYEFVKSSGFEPEMVSAFSEINFPNGSLKDYIVKAFEKLTVDQGMPPATDPWGCRAAENVVQLLKEQPAIVAHSQNTFDGSGVKRLLSNRFELDKMDTIMSEALKMFDAGDGKTVKEDEFKKLLTEVLGSIMLQLEGNPVSGYAPDH